MLLSYAIDSFISYKLKRMGSSKTTEITYRSILAGFLACVGDKEVGELTISDIDHYADEMIKLSYKTKTLHNKLATVRSLVKYLYSRDYTNIRPERVELPRVIETEANFLTEEEQTALINIIDSPRDRAIISTLLSSGLRVSELINLYYDDLYDTSIVVRCGKGGKSRLTFITEECKDAISDYLKTKKRTDTLFTNCNGVKLSRQYIARTVTEYAVLAGIEKHVSPHTLRHTFATNMLRNGARVEVVQKFMGHANIRTTLIYMHFTNPYLQNEYEKFSTKMAINH